MSDHLEINLRILSQRQPELARLLNEPSPGRVRLSPSFRGAPTAHYLRDPRNPIPIHSRYDPQLEARKSVAGIDLNGVDYFVLLGYGLGYNLEALLERIDAKTAHVFVVESDLEILRAAFSARDLSASLTLPHLWFAWPPAGNKLAEQWQQFFDPVDAHKSVFITHAPSLTLNPELYESAAEAIKSKTLQIFTDINTLVATSTVFLENFVTNFSRACAAPGINAFTGKFQGVPAILVSAGPSLDRNIADLKGYEEAALIVATDTTIRPLRAAGVEPHFIMSGDPGHANYLHLEGAHAPKSLLVAEACAYPETLAMFDGRSILCTFENSSLGPLSDLLSAKGSLRAWGSVATMCVDFALLLGCNPILFIGQDLAFTEGRTYCSGLHWEKQRFQHVNNPDQWHDCWAAISASDQRVQARDIFGRPVESTARLLSYWNWISAEIEAHPGARFVNATEGGVLRENVEIMSLRHALHRFCPRRLDLRGTIRQLYEAAANGVSAVPYDTLGKITAEAHELQTVVEQAFEACLKIDPACSDRNLLKRLEKWKESVRALTMLAPLIDNFNQMGNVAFIRGYNALKLQPTVKLHEVRDLYLDYFSSVDAASKPILQSLTRLTQVAAVVTSRQRNSQCPQQEVPSRERRPFTAPMTT